VLGICVEKRKSFCCYKSFLSRLFMEEFRLNQNLGGGPGDPADPNCEGLTIEQLQSADWSRVDLTPYIRRMEDAGILPTTAY
jgi:conjugal transfer mating pair stabilization protein TraN